MTGYNARLHGLASRQPAVYANTMEWNQSAFGMLTQHKWTYTVPCDLADYSL